MELALCCEWLEIEGQNGELWVTVQLSREQLDELLESVKASLERVSHEDESMC
jgi:hypothetical protein